MAKKAAGDPAKKDFSGPRLHGKKYRNAQAKFEKEKLHSLEEAIALAKETSTTAFDASIEVHINTALDVKQADQQLRGIVSLPNGTGKKVNIVAFVDESKIKESTAAGASLAGTEALVEKINSGWLDFDIAVATPDQMKSIGKIAKILGQAGKMPNPKAGTVTPDPVKAIEEISKGQVEYRNDKDGNLHNIVGKVSFGEEKLTENLKTYLKTIIQAKPAGAKGTYLNSITITTSMGPGIKLDPSTASSK